MTIMSYLKDTLSDTSGEKTDTIKEYYLIMKKSNVTKINQLNKTDHDIITRYSNICDNY